MTSPADGIQATLPSTYNPSSATLNSSGSGKASEMLDSQAFLQLLVAQLKYQDPTNPVDTSNFMNQTAMLSQVQTMNTMSTTLSDMMSAQQSATATGMLGKAISFLDPSGNLVAGIVDVVSMNNGVARLHVGDLAVPLAGVVAVAEPTTLSDGGIDPAEGAGDATDTGDTADTGGTGSADAASDSSGASTPADDAPADDTLADDAPADDATAATDDPTGGTGAAADPATSPAPTLRPDTITA